MAAQTLTTTPAVIITPAEFLQHWQGHRALTRRVIERFPEEALLNHRIGGMRTFAQLTQELLDLGLGVKGIATREWPQMTEMTHNKNLHLTKEELLQRWDALTDTINEYWAKITPERFHETDKAFGMYEGTVISLALYLVDNEIHHRGQGYVYLRSLGIEPPPFWDRP
ncbi:DinB family protein [Deminuibacter soli]|uniref:Damage-inducible protein DinB n=1 Tax=Deminuibacter soli TaxID=2291815 RepID=A0A3E1NK31_9BACT|nr:DinB family protein [Deminuibacter soli]RFM28296.1 damage-inducible protein DinB [Deminuibacter soli]